MSELIFNMPQWPHGNICRYRSTNSVINVLFCQPLDNWHHRFYLLDLAVDLTSSCATNLCTHRARNCTQKETITTKHKVTSHIPIIIGISTTLILSTTTRVLYHLPANVRGFWSYSYLKFVYTVLHCSFVRCIFKLSESFYIGNLLSYILNNHKISRIYTWALALTTSRTIELPLLIAHFPFCHCLRCNGVPLKNHSQFLTTAPDAITFL